MSWPVGLPLYKGNPNIRAIFSGPIFSESTQLIIELPVFILKGAVEKIRKSLDDGKVVPEYKWTNVWNPLERDSAVCQYSHCLYFIAFRCRICGATFRSSYSKNSHMKQVHANASVTTSASLGRAISASKSAAAAKAGNSNSKNVVKKKKKQPKNDQKMVINLLKC